MKYTIPDYYRDFRCIAGDCPATCCAGWQIVIDGRSLKKYRNYEGAFGSRLANSIDWEEGTFQQYDGRCAFLDEQNLCDIYSEAGPDMLCRTCRNYPRHIEEFENEREISLSLSCPVAAEMILERKEKVIFLTAEKDGEEEEDEEFDFFLYSALQDCRSVMIEVIQDRSEPIDFRMAKVLALAHDVQNRINARRIFETESLLLRYQAEGANEKLKKKFRKYCGAEGEMKRSRELLLLLDELEVLDASWTKQLAKWREALYGEGEYGYAVKLMKWYDAMNKADVSDKAGISDRAGIPDKAGVPYELEMEQLMVYFLFTYFCGAVYDGDAFAKVKMAVCGTLMLRELWMADEILFGQTEHEKEVCSRRKRIAWRFSRELEHSDPNLDRMEELMNERDAASFETLLQMIFAVQKIYGRNS